MAPRNVRSLHRLFNGAAVLLFFGTLGIPLLDEYAGIFPQKELTENRVKVQAPTVEDLLRAPGSFPQRFEAFYEDGFSLRSLFLYAYNRLRSEVCGLRIADRILVGKEGWFYVTDNATIEDFQGARRIAPHELLKIRDRLEAWNRRLATMGILYLPVAAPAKWEIYPEYLPESITRVRKDSILDQLHRYLGARCTVEILDLRGPLLAEKPKFQLYEKTGTHWSEAGVLVTVRALRQALARTFPELHQVGGLKDLQAKKAPDRAGDLALMMGLQDILVEPRWGWERPGPRLEPLPESGPEIRQEGKRVRYRAKAGSKGIKALVFHNSFGDQIAPLLADSFRESLFVWESVLDFDLIEKERPDVVIHQLGQRRVVEHLLNGPCPPGRSISE